MRVFTLNLWGRRGDWPARRRVLVDGLRELRPDLVAFIEAIRTDEYDQVLDLLGDGYHVTHQVKREDGQGASIGSRWPIDRVHEVDLNVTPRTADFACTTPVAEIAAPEPFGPLVFVDHVPSWQLQYEQERELQALAAARFVEELAGERHVIFAGDFNADPDSAGVRFLTGRQSLDGRASATAMPGRARTQASRARPRRRGTPSSTTGTGRSGGSTTSSSAAASTAGRRSPSPTAPSVFDEPADGVWASDHFGVVADLEPPLR